MMWAGVLLALVVLGAALLYFTGLAMWSIQAKDAEGMGAALACVGALLLLFAVAVYITP